jgi:hypothetical protein
MATLREGLAGTAGVGGALASIELEDVGDLGHPFYRAHAATALKSSAHGRVAI